MKANDIRDLILLAALWGASFMFMRVAAPAFGPLMLVELRVLLASLFLLPFVLRRKHHHQLRDKAFPLTVVGLFNSALPFCLFTWALLELSSGFTAIINATAPLFGAVIGAAFYNAPFNRRKTIGLLIGFAGVVCLITSKGDISLEGSIAAMLAAFSAAACYGFAANYSGTQLKDTPALLIAFGSQLAASAILLPLALLSPPTAPPELIDWAAVLILGVACTGIAYLLYFRLIANIGATNAVSVTFLIPAFAMGWGWLVIDEAVSIWTVLSGIIILMGTAITMGLLRLPGRKPSI